MKRVKSVSAVIVALAVVATGCSKDSARNAGAGTASIKVVPTTPATFVVRESVNQLSVTGAKPDTSLELFDASSRKVAGGKVDSQGSLLLREVPAGVGYQVRATGSRPEASKPLKVLAEKQSLPPRSFYSDQKLAEGFGYITTRDGTKLSVSVYLPGPADQGPYPTVVEYSGYSPSNPTKNLSKDLAKSLGVAPESLCGLSPVVCKTPDQPGSLLASAMGFAVVAVNMRGTGCSGGAYDYFERLQILDGYDIIETAAAQPWALNHKVGMVGLSYPGISQLFVAASQPPSLAAITPLSVYDDTARGLLAPGGIYNEGFTLQWVREVGEKAQPYGQAWSKKVADAGDATCADNQKLRLQNVDVAAKAKANPYYTNKVGDPLNPMLFAKNIKVPVFLTGAWQDEQTGGRFARLFTQFTNSPVTRFTAFNGAHADGLAPQVLSEWKAFLDIYVAGKITGVPEPLKKLAPQLLKAEFSVALTFPEDRWSSTEPFQQVKAQFEAEKPTRMIFESGGGEPSGGPVGRFEKRFASWPPEGTKATSRYLQPDGSLGTSKPPTAGGASQLAWDPSRGEKVTLPGKSTGDAFHAFPDYQWEQDPPGKAAVFETAALAADQVFTGPASADLWIRSTANDADVEVTVSEIRPDGKETYVSAGVQRASFRALTKDSTELDVNPSMYKATMKKLKPGEWTKIRVGVFPFAHIFRAGSKIRISVHTPGGDRPRWSWILADLPADTVFDVAHDAKHPSKIVLPLNDTVTGYPDDRPPCPSLRGQPCRDAMPYTNTPSE